MKGKALAIVVLMLLLIPTGPAEAADKPGKYQKNESYGFKVRVPAKWNVIHMDTKEQWIALKAIGPRELQGSKDDWWGERPEMWVIAFPHERQKQRGARREKVNENTTIIKIENPYKDYPDFVRREKRIALGGSGFFFSREDTTTHNGMDIDIYEVKAEKMTETPRRMFTWVWHTEDVDYAIQFRIVEKHFESFERTFATCAKSFKLIPRTKPMPGTATTGKKVIETKNERDMTPEERKKKRVEAVENYLKDEIANLPKDWFTMDSDHFCAISHGDKKFTKRVMNHAEKCLGYLEKTFPGMGSDHVPRGVIRVFKDDAEQSAFQQGTRSVWDNEVQQIMVSADKNWTPKYEYEYLGENVTRLWLRYKNKSLYEAMPWWLQNGLEDHVGMGRPKKGKALKFSPDEWDSQELVKMAKGGKTIPMRDFFSGDNDAKDTNSTPWGSFENMRQAGSVVHWLLTKGNRKPVKGAVQTYLATLVAVVEEEDRKFEEEQAEIRRKAEERAKARAEKGDSDDEEGDDEDDEDEGRKAAEEAWKAYAKKLAEKKKMMAERCFAAAFAHVTDKQWKRLDATWLKFASKGGR